MDIRQALDLLSLRIKIQDKTQLSWIDVPEIIPLRWQYLRTNWKPIKALLQQRIDYISDNDTGLKNRLNLQLDDLDSLVFLKSQNTKNDNPFLNKEYIGNFYDIYGLLLISDIQVLSEESYIINKNINKVVSLNKKDFLEIRQAITEYRDQISERSGVIDAEFNTVYNRMPATAVKELDVSDILNTQNFQESIKAVNYILFQLSQNEEKPIDPFLLAKVNANNPDFNVQSYVSGKLVAFHYEDTLQDIAYRYLGDRDKWLEIAIANGLMPPYVDEDGEKIYIINAYDNVVILPEYDTDGNKNIEKLYDYQPIFIKSSTELVMDQRLIESVTLNSINHTIAITLNGNSNLSIYTLADSSYIRVYKQNTINSNFMILIPSNDPLPGINKNTPWFLATSAQDEKNAKIDLYIDENKELHYNSFGDMKLSYGLNNAIQAIILKITTIVGSLSRHPDFGLTDVVGFRNSDSQKAKDLLVNNIMSMIERDPRFNRLEYISAEYTENLGNTILIKIVVKLAGSNTSIPITYSLNLG